MQDSGLDKLPSFPVDEFFIIRGTTIPIWWSDCTQLIVIDRNWILVSSKFLQWCHRVVESSQQWAADIFKLTPVGAETNLSDPFMDLNLFLDSGVDPCSEWMPHVQNRSSSKLLKTELTISRCTKCISSWFYINRSKVAAIVSHVWKVYSTQLTSSLIRLDWG